MLLTLADGRAAQYWSGGAGTGPAVVFFHGCPDTRWAAMTGEAAAREVGVRLVCVNRPGYGLSSRHASSHATVADDVAEVLDLLALERVAVLGMSVGGPYAVTMATRHPDRVGALGVAASLPMDATDDDSVDGAMERYRPDFESFVSGIDPTDPDDRALADRWLATMPAQDAALLAPAGPGFVAASVREALADPDGYLRDAALLWREWPTRPGDVRCPTRLWYGGLDVRARRGGDWFAARIPGAVLELRATASHWATLADHWAATLGWLGRTMREERAGA